MTPAKILIVDDEVELERLIRQRFRKKIKAKELDFLFAINGQAALEQLQTDHQIDMVITDINMPHMDGLTLLGKLSALDRSLRAVVMSAYSDMHNIRKAMNQGAFDFLVKPIDFQDLEITIQKTLDFVQQIRAKQEQIQQAQRQLQHFAYHDPLTELPNRARFRQRLTERITQQTSRPEYYAILFMDLDCFKSVNDQFGHSAGDQLLKCVAQRLQGCLRERDMVSRLGGDEFAILLDSVYTLDEVTAVATRILERLQHPFQLGEFTVKSQASIGIALSQSAYAKPEALLHDADVAMYCAKKQGKGRFEVFNLSLRTELCPPMSAGFIPRLDLPTDPPIQSAAQEFG